MKISSEIREPFATPVVGPTDPDQDCSQGRNAGGRNVDT